MRKHCLEILFLVVICFGVSCTSFAQIQTKDHMLTVTIQKDTYYYSEPIQLTIKYKNNGTTDWSLRKPDNALSVEVYTGYIGDVEKALSYSMGEIQSIPGPEGSNIMAFTMPEPEYMVIKAGEEYTLTSTLPWPGSIFPGKWILWVEDTIEKLKTDTNIFYVVFTKKSVDILFSIAKNSEKDSYERSKHTTYLREIKTDMPYFRWPYWKHTPEKNKQKEALIQIKLKEFEEFWNKERNSPNTEMAIERINKVCRELTELPRSFNVTCPDILKSRR